MFLTCRRLFSSVDKIVSFYRFPEPPLSTLSTAATARRFRSRPLKGLHRSCRVRACGIESLRYGEEARAKSHRACLDVVRHGLLCGVPCKIVIGGEEEGYRKATRRERGRGREEGSAGCTQRGGWGVGRSVQLRTDIFSVNEAFDYGDAVDGYMEIILCGTDFLRRDHRPPPRCDILHLFCLFPPEESWSTGYGERYTTARSLHIAALPHLRSRISSE